MRSGAGRADDRLDPETMKCSIDVYPESKFLSTIALRKDQPGVSGHRISSSWTPAHDSSSPRRSMRL